MHYAIGLTVVVAGAVLVYSGFKNVDVWATILNAIRGGSVAAVQHTG